MLKGTTKIELTDVNTGETQVIEKHNSVTGALQELFSPVLGHLTDEAKLIANLPAYTSLLGGLYLFDGRIESDPLPLFAPDNVKLVGCARYNYANTLGSTYIGSYDMNESVLSPAAKTAKLVYNFTQAQANGTINSVCLTHRTGGYGVYRSDVTTKSSSTKLAANIFDAPTNKIVRNKCDRLYGIDRIGNDYEYIYVIDVDNDIGYYFKFTAANTIVLLKRRLGLKQFSMFGSAASLIEESAPITLPTGIRYTNSTLNYNTYNFDAETNNLYIYSALPGASSTSLPVGSQFTVTTIKLGENTVTQKTLTNHYSTTISLHNAYVYRGRLYTNGASTTGTVNGRSAKIFPVVSFDINDNTIATHGTVHATTASSSSVKTMFAESGRLYWQGYMEVTYGIGCLQVTDCTATPGDTNTTVCGVDCIDYYSASSTAYPPSCIPVLNHPMLKYISYGYTDDGTPEGFVYLTNYLGTVNNLSTPIVKAPTQTMKITYTIQEV